MLTSSPGLWTYMDHPEVPPRRMNETCAPRWTNSMAKLKPGKSSSVPSSSHSAYTVTTPRWLAPP